MTYVYIINTLLKAVWLTCLDTDSRKKIEHSAVKKTHSAYVQKAVTTGFTVCTFNSAFLSLKCPYFHSYKRLWDMTVFFKQEVISSWDQLNACACIMYDVCVRKKKRDSGKRRESSLAELLSSLNVPKWVLGKRKPCGFWRINKPVSFGCV